MYGGAGDDILALSDLNFRRIKGGAGTDTLRLDGSGVSRGGLARTTWGVAQ
ncbi:MAG: hypothetical protein KME26_23170 [Oscillatoria princeps RMCB-10]|nr:hypothetical protein [Oscillatoria princeps RMCB-10]